MPAATTQAVIDGTSPCERELQPVLRALRNDHIDMVAIHQHMTLEEPRTLFLHDWGKGKPDHLAQALKRVLDAQAAVKS